MPGESGGESRPAAGAEAASLIVVDPSGHRSRVAIEPLPFRIGRHAENHLILRDSRASRTHARIVAEGGEYWLEDCGSRHGTFLNGRRVARAALRNADRIDFGAPDSYQLIFALDAAEMRRLMEQIAAPEGHPGQGVGANMAKLRAILDLARTLQSSFSVDDVLAQVVDAALAVTGTERGFLMLRTAQGLETRVARHRRGHKLREDDLRVPREVLHRALQHRRELLSMNFDPVSAGTTAQNSIADLELRSVVCVPLVRIRAGQGDATSVLKAGAETVGLLYMDSRVAAADLAGGNRELLQTLAIEASTVLENARLLEEERAKQQMEEELRLARTIQQSLLPGRVPEGGWLRAAGSSVASRQVGGDYFDVTNVAPHCWSAVVADVSGKGVASALLASLIQGALIAATDHPAALGHRTERLNRFLLDRTGGEKYATVFYCLIMENGALHYVNAGHCAPLLVRPDGAHRTLEATAMPVGMLDGAEYAVAAERLERGDKIVIYTDGVSEAQNTAGEYFGKRRIREVAAAHAGAGCADVHRALQDAVAAFTEGAAQTDDITLLVLEYAG
ncbi:MAG TPA: SpoIIE family protein phosphatase [Bryobacteraceae bacterium]|jgi:serine phosphatase RsbU (regulator of sigma subunit)|nr:SpoIIE family protein phosphatase [Bryobacteraceae bacterium]